jgi:hypothetical protein
VEDTSECRRLSEAALGTVRERFTIEGNARCVEQHLLRAIRSEPLDTAQAGLGSAYAG